MNQDDYEKLRDDTGTDHDIDRLARFAEGAALLVKLGGAEMAAEHDIIYCGGPEIKDLSEADAKRLCELGFCDYCDDMGFQFFT